MLSGQNKKEANLQHLVLNKKHIIVHIVLEWNTISNTSYL